MINILLDRLKLEGLSLRFEGTVFQGDRSIVTLVNDLDGSDMYSVTDDTVEEAIASVIAEALGQFASIRDNSLEANEVIHDIPFDIGVK